MHTSWILWNFTWLKHKHLLNRIKMVRRGPKQVCNLILDVTFSTSQVYNRKLNTNSYTFSDELKHFFHFPIAQNDKTWIQEPGVGVCENGHPFFFFCFVQCSSLLCITCPYVIVCLCATDKTNAHLFFSLCPHNSYSFLFLLKNCSNIPFHLPVAFPFCTCTSHP